MLKNRKSISAFAVVAFLLLSIGAPALSTAAKTRPVQLKSPQNIVVTPTLPIGNFTVSWNSVPSATSYTVRVYNSSGRTLVGPAITLAVSVLPVTKSANTSYRVSVQAIGNGSTYSNSPESGKYSLTTFASTYAITWNDSCPDGINTCTTSSSGGASTYLITSAVTSIPTSAPAAAGYSFGGWFTQTAGAGTQVTNGTYTPASPYGAITFYAKWSATSSSYAIGDPGPGGGIIYYYDSVGFNCGVGFSSTGSPTGGLCHYLEVAPDGWKGSGGDLLAVWALGSQPDADITGIANENPDAYNNALGIGLGYKNSNLIVTQGNDATTAAGAARAYTSIVLTVTYSDWYLPTTAELNLLCQWNRWVTQLVTTQCTGGAINSGTGASSAGFGQTFYWSSSEYLPDSAWIQNFYDGDQFNNFKTNTFYVRPVRAF